MLTYRFLAAQSYLRPFLFLICAVLLSTLHGCSSPELIDDAVTKNTYLELVDWHISGLFIINCPVAWIRVANYNAVPIKDIVFKYLTYDAEGHFLNEGTYTLEETVPPGSVKNYIELYLGLVDLHSEKLRIQLVSASPG